MSHHRELEVRVVVAVVLELAKFAAVAWAPLTRGPLFFDAIPTS